MIRSWHFGCLFSSAEAYGISNLECLRLGVPVLARRVGGIPDTVPEGLGLSLRPRRARGRGGRPPGRICGSARALLAAPRAGGRSRRRIFLASNRRELRRSLAGLRRVSLRSAPRQRASAASVHHSQRLGWVMSPATRTRFVVAFNGARDAYQVALALHERDLLRKLVTDLYVPSGIARFSAWLPALEKLSSRNAPGLPFRKVQWNSRLLYEQHVRDAMARFGVVASRSTPLSLQSVLSLAALRVAEASDANLFCYTGYAHEAFEARRSDRTVKGLFQYHPYHADLIFKILSLDLRKNANFINRDQQTTRGTIRRKESSRTSSFGLRCMCEHIHCAIRCDSGIPPNKIHVVPYGIDPVSNPRIAPELQNMMNHADVCRFLFVGSGIIERDSIIYSKHGARCGCRLRI